MNTTALAKTGKKINMIKSATEPSIRVYLGVTEGRDPNPENLIFLIKYESHSMMFSRKGLLDNAADNGCFCTFHSRAAKIKTVRQPVKPDST